MISSLILFLCLMGTVSAASNVKEHSSTDASYADAATQTPDFSETDHTALENFSHLISTITNKGPRSEKRLTRLSLARLNFNTLYKEGSPELKEALAALTETITRALSTTAWSTHTKEVRVNGMVRVAFDELETLITTPTQKELLTQLHRNFQIGLAPALIGLRETIRKKLPLKTLLALTILVGGGFAAYKMSLGKKLINKVMDTAKKKFSREFQALQHVGELARVDQSKIAAYELLRQRHSNVDEVLNPTTNELQFTTPDGTVYTRPESTAAKGINAVHLIAKIAPLLRDQLAAETAKDRDWFNAHHIVLDPADSSRRMVRVGDEMRYLSSKTVDSPDDEQKTSLKLYEENGTWYKTYFREPLLQRMLQTADRGFAIGAQLLALADRKDIKDFLTNINFKFDLARSEFIGWARDKGIWDEEHNKIMDGVRIEFNPETQIMTYINAAGTGYNAPQSITTLMFKTIRDLIADGSASAELIKAITQQITNSLQNNKMFLQQFGLWDETIGGLKTKVINESAEYPVEYNQDNGRPYYRVNKKALPPDIQEKLSRQPTEATGSIVIELSSPPSTQGGGAGAGAGAGSGSTTTTEERPMTTEVVIETGTDGEYVKIYAPLSPVERLFLVLDRAQIEDPADLIRTLIMAAKNFTNERWDHFGRKLKHDGWVAKKFLSPEELKRLASLPHKIES